jgi:hypothetical protein
MRVCVCVGVGMVARARACASERATLLIQNATRMRHIACGLFVSTIFLDIFSKMVSEYKICVFILSTIFI